MYEAFFYFDEKGHVPVRDFLDGLTVKTRKKAAGWIELLEKEGPELKRPYADKVEGDLYALRVRLSSDNVLNDELINPQYDES